MKYVAILGDGMADEPIESLGNKTILQAADTPFLDMLSKKSEIGMVHTVPDGMAPGSDTANLSVLGYDPKIYYSGRSPLEALSIGVPMTDTDIALRCNIVTISEEEGVPYEEQTIIDHSSSEISTEDCGILLEAVRKELENDIFKFYLGTSYRHCTIWHNGSVVKLTPPHDVLGQKVGPNLPETESLREMMKKSYEILKNHPLNIERKKKGLNPANSCWFWGAGTKPALSSFEEKTGKKGVMISFKHGVCGGILRGGCMVLPAQAHPERGLFPPDGLGLCGLHQGAEAQPHPPEQERHRPPGAGRAGLLRGDGADAHVSPEQRRRAGKHGPAGRPLRPARGIPEFPPSPPLLPYQYGVYRQYRSTLHHDAGRSRGAAAPREVFGNEGPLPELYF